MVCVGYDALPWVAFSCLTKWSGEPRLGGQPSGVELHRLGGLVVKKVDLHADMGDAEFEGVADAALLNVCDVMIPQVVGVMKEYEITYCPNLIHVVDHFTMDEQCVVSNFRASVPYNDSFHGRVRVIPDEVKAALGGE